jgi:peptide/nickel transport system ATP-binding protein
MYLGRIVEFGNANDVLQNPQHPYSKALISAVPSLTTQGSLVPQVMGDVPMPINPPSGCHFHPRCKHYAENKNAPWANACNKEYPAQNKTGPENWACCHAL